MNFEAVLRPMLSCARVGAALPLSGGVSAEVHAVTVRYDDDRTEEVVVRRHRAIAGKPEAGARASLEYALLGVLHGRGVPTPRPRGLIPPDTLVLDRMPGSTTLPDGAAAPMAAALAAIHATPLRGLPALPLREDPQVALRAWLPDLLGEQRLAGVGATPCLLHGDFWPGNLLWSNGTLSVVLDWEDAALGDAMSDVACARVELACAAGEAVAEAFTTHYLTLTSTNAEGLAAWDLYASTAALHYMAQWGLAPDVLANRRAKTLAFQRRAIATLVDRGCLRRDRSDTSEAGSPTS
jgi:aminoglycoside phosphotransferase (APT) family kinase protein